MAGKHVFRDMHIHDPYSATMLRISNAQIKFTKHNFLRMIEKPGLIVISVTAVNQRHRQPCIMLTYAELFLLPDRSPIALKL